MNCSICGETLIGKQTLFCSRQCRCKSTNIKHQCYESQKARGLVRKISFVNKLGGKCSVCGYDKNLSAIDFHHKHGKDFQLDMRRLSNNSLDVLEKEIERCVLLCATCHREEHHPNYGNWKIGAIGIEPTTNSL